MKILVFNCSYLFNNKSKVIYKFHCLKITFSVAGLFSDILHSVYLVRCIMGFAAFIFWAIISDYSQ